MKYSGEGLRFARGNVARVPYVNALIIVSVFVSLIVIIIVSVFVERRTGQLHSGPGHEHLVVTHVRVIRDEEEARRKPPRFQKLGSIGIPQRERVVCGSRVLNGDHAKTQARISSRLYVQRVISLAGVVSNRIPHGAKSAA